MEPTSLKIFVDESDQGNNRSVSSFAAPSLESGELPIELWYPGEIPPKSGDACNGFVSKGNSYESGGPGQNTGSPLWGTESHMANYTSFKNNYPGNSSSYVVSHRNPGSGTNSNATDDETRLGDDAVNELSAFMMDDLRVPPPLSAGPSPTYGHPESPDMLIMGRSLHPDMRHPHDMLETPPFASDMWSLSIQSQSGDMVLPPSASDLYPLGDGITNPNDKKGVFSVSPSQKFSSFAPPYSELSQQRNLPAYNNGDYSDQHGVEYPLDIQFGSPKNILAAPKTQSMPLTKAHTNSHSKSQMVSKPQPKSVSRSASMRRITGVSAEAQSEIMAATSPRAMDLSRSRRSVSPGDLNASSQAQFMDQGTAQHFSHNHQHFHDLKPSSDYTASLHSIPTQPLSSIPSSVPLAASMRNSTMSLAHQGRALPLSDSSSRVGMANLGPGYLDEDVLLMNDGTGLVRTRITNDNLPSSNRRDRPSDMTSVGQSSTSGEGSPAYTCPHCSAAFRVRGYLTRHMRKHADVMKFNCPLFHTLPDESKCHQTGGFSRGDTFKMHMKARHFIYPKGTSRKNRTNCAGQCGGCGKDFENNELWFKEHIVAGKCPRMSNTAHDDAT